MKKFKFPLIILILLILLPILPYKTPALFKITPKNQVKLQLEDTVSSGGLNVIKGEDTIKKYLKDNNLNETPSDEVYVKGNTMYKDLTTFRLGLPIHTKFTVYGILEQNFPNDGNLITINIDKWYPIGNYVWMYNTYLWKNYHLSFIRILLIICCVFYIVIKYIVLKISKKSRRTK